MILHACHAALLETPVIQITYHMPVHQQGLETTSKSESLYDSGRINLNRIQLRYNGVHDCNAHVDNLKQPAKGSADYYIGSVPYLTRDGYPLWQCSPLQQYISFFVCRLY
jgi:hypothetical protein